jgi:hypothetical protein
MRKELTAVPKMNKVGEKYNWQFDRLYICNYSFASLHYLIQLRRINKLRFDI